MKLSAVIQSAALSTLLAAAPWPTLACGAAGPNTHIGRVMSVDRNCGVFTRVDAETTSPLTLAADAAPLDQVSSISGSVVVTYEENGDTLRALELK